MYKQVVSTGVIHRAVAPGKAGDKNKGIAPVAPQMESIQPGTIFTAGTERLPEYGGKSEYEHLRDIGVIRDYVGSERTLDDLDVRPRQTAADIADAERRAADIKAIADSKAAQDAARLQAEADAKAKAEADRIAQEEAARRAEEEANRKAVAEQEAADRAAREKAEADKAAADEKAKAEADAAAKAKTGKSGKKAKADEDDDDVV